MHLAISSKSSAGGFGDANMARMGRKKEEFHLQELVNKPRCSVEGGHEWIDVFSLGRIDKIVL